MFKIDRIGRIIGQIKAPERRDKGRVIADDKVVQSRRGWSTEVENQLLGHALGP